MTGFVGNSGFLHCTWSDSKANMFSKLISYLGERATNAGVWDQFSLSNLENFWEFCLSKYEVQGLIYEMRDSILTRVKKFQIKIVKHQTKESTISQQKFHPAYLEFILMFISISCGLSCASFISAKDPFYNKDTRYVTEFIYLFI